MYLAVLQICDRVFDADLENGICISYTSKQKFLKEQKVALCAFILNEETKKVKFD